MAVYVYDAERGCMVDKKTREPMLTEEERKRDLQAPLTYGDLPGYHSPIDGRWIEGRRARKYDMESNGCVDANDFGTPKRFKNQRFIEKRGLHDLADQ